MFCFSDSSLTQVSQQQGKPRTPTRTTPTGCPKGKIIVIKIIFVTLNENEKFDGFFPKYFFYFD